MADIFISYARKDRKRIEPLAVALEERGWSVWWDRRFRPGEDIQKKIRLELAAARCVIVAWSVRALQSSWVEDEAREGHKRGVLVPILLEEGINPPLGLGVLHAADLSTWHGQKTHVELEHFLSDVREILASPPVAETARRREEVDTSPPIAENRPAEGRSQRGFWDQARVWTTSPPSW